jgi:hypothetical protein
MFPTNFNQSLSGNINLIGKPLTLGHKISDYDIFIAYEQSCQDKLYRLSNLLTTGLNLSVSLDKPEVDLTMKRLYNKIIHKIIKSKLVVCCVNRNFIKSQKCRDELIIAYTYSKPVIVLLFEEIRLGELSFIDFLSRGGPTLTLGEYFESNGQKNMLFLTELTEVIEKIVDRKLKISPIYSKNPNKEAITEGSNQNNIDETQFYIDDDTSSSLEYEKVSNGYDSIYEKIFLNPNIVNLRLFNNSNMIQFAFGFNRIVYLESKERFLITSSYFKSIISLDKTGKYIDKRNPGGLMKFPFAICLDKNNQIYIGDNQLKCIFVFDQNFKHLRTFAQSLLGGYYDMVIDDACNTLYTLNVYDSIVVSIDIKKDVIINSVYVSAPQFIGLLRNTIIVLTANDKINVISERTFKVRFRFDIKHAKYLSALCTYKSVDAVFLTCHEILVDKTKSKNVYLCVIKIDSSKSAYTKKIYLDTNQVNDMVLTNKSMVCVSDTHVAVFKYSDVEGLLKWSVNV